MERIQTSLDVLRKLWLQATDFLPQLFGAVVLLIFGWIVARLVRAGSIRLFQLMKLDVVSEKAGIDGFLKQGGVKGTSVTILANLVYWLIMLTVIVAVLNFLGLQTAAELFNRIILYVPNVVVAVLVLMFGTLFAKFVRGVTSTYLSNIGVDGAEFVSQVAQWAILIFVVSAALEQLAIGGLVLVSAFQIAFGALCLALALAFGLGGRDWASRMLEKLWKK